MCNRTKSVLLDYYEALLERYGHQGWWPAETRFEMVAGAILTQNTNWKNVEKALAELRKEKLMTPGRLSSTDVETLSSYLRPVGYFRVKARRLLNFVDFFKKGYQLDFDRFKSIETSRLREELLHVQGIGPETADSILLYALDRPVFVVDTYTRRVLARHQIIRNKSAYDDIQRLFMSNLPVDAALFNEYHALLVRVGKDFCRTKPDCERCPLRCFLARRPEQL